ncbi:MAG: tetratricopeptide repeat protein [Nitrosomonadales bacterium]|nr:tetratricopeptide repeat protein [Nitrosomonadales bacterium]
MKPGRNDPCSCGSGKKYKHCCEGKDTARHAAPEPSEASQLLALLNAGRFPEVESRARALLAQYPDFATGWKLLGAALHMQGKDSLPTLQKAAELFPGDAEAHNHLGNALKDRGQYRDAAASYRRSLEIKPNSPGALYNLGMALREIGQVHEAIACCRRALKLKPDFADAHNNLGNFLKDAGLLDEAVESYRRALKLDPDNVIARSNLLFVLNYSAKYSPETCLEEARQYGRVAARLAKGRFTAWRCAAAPQRLRVGIVSGDLYGHPVGHFLESTLAQIDQSRVELVAYATSQKADELTARIRPHFAAWRTLHNQSDEGAARLIHADGVHVLLDIAGHTAHNRLPVFAWKPAPVQATWLGYFATTGVTGMDYLLADEVGVPEALRQHFTESIWYLPDTRLCFSAPDIGLAVAPLPAQTNQQFTFGCFQNLAKVSDGVLAVWGKIFALLPEARLRMQCNQLADPAVVEQTLQRLQQHGIDHARVTLHGALRREDYLAAHSEVDLILDTFPYPGGTTTCEALWMGVPTLTLAGDSLLARQGASLLAAAGLNEWIAASKDEYIAKAIAFAHDRHKLAMLRAGLREQAGRSPLFDAPRFARNLEDALWGMWQARRDAPA